MTAIGLGRATSEADFGGKAVSLGQAMRGGLRVPRGVAVSFAAVEAVCRGDAPALDRIALALDEFADRDRFAVRSSAVGEDSENATFAGQHLTRLGVLRDDVRDAIVAVRDSGRAEAALAYRRRLGLDPTPRVAVVIQTMLDPDCAGVMFTRDPRDGADQRVIEASWGLGEAVVTGMVTPDRVVMKPGGRVVQHEIGRKDVAVRLAATGGSVSRPVPADRIERACLDESRLSQLDALASRCDEHFEGAHDIEWAFVGDDLFLLQRRAVTR